jgi:hypothetical protein
MDILLAELVDASEKTSSARLENNFADTFPVKASEFVAQRNLAGPLYNYFDWGGYLIWRLPELSVSMDGRTNIYGGARIAQSIATMGLRARMKTDPESLSSNLVIGPVGMPLSARLKDDSRFRLVYQDSVAAVIVKQAK